MRDLSQRNTATKPALISAFSINMALIALILIFGLVYVFSINAQATANYKIKKLAVDVSELDQQNQKLQLQSSTLQSVPAIQAASTQYNFVPTSNITYLRQDNFALK